MKEKKKKACSVDREFLPRSPFFETPENQEHNWVRSCFVLFCFRRGTLLRWTALFCKLNVCNESQLVDLELGVAYR